MATFKAFDKIGAYAIPHLGHSGSTQFGRKQSKLSSCGFPMRNSLCMTRKRQKLYETHRQRTMEVQGTVQIPKYLRVIVHSIGHDYVHIGRFVRIDSVLRALSLYSMNLSSPIYT